MKNQRKGFTLIEVTLSILLIAILIAITTPLVSNVVIRADLNSAHESLYNTILRAQNLSKIQSRNQQWRVCIDNTAKQYIIAAGTCSSPLYPETIKFSSNITISSTQTLDLQFTAIKGELYYAGNFSKITLSSGGVSKSIIVNQNGVIDKAATSDPSNTTATPSIVTNGLVLNLDAGNIASYPGTGTTWTDLSGNNNNGTLVNGVGYNSANGGSLAFNGINQYVNSTSISSQFTTDMSVEGWVYISAYSGDWVRIVGTGGNSGNRTFGLWYYGPTGQILWQRYGAADPGIFTTQPYLATGSWNYITATTSGSSHVLYLNASSVGTATASGPWPSSNENITIGFAGFHTYHNGRISNVRLYNRGLTVSEVQQNFNATKGRYGL